MSSQPSASVRWRAAPRKFTHLLLGDDNGAHLLPASSIVSLLRRHACIGSTCAAPDPDFVRECTTHRGRRGVDHRHCVRHAHLVRRAFHRPHRLDPLRQGLRAWSWIDCRVLRPRPARLNTRAILALHNLQVQARLAGSLCASSPSIWAIWMSLRLPQKQQILSPGGGVALAR